MMMKQSLLLLRSAIVDARAVKPPLEAISLLAHSEGEKKKALPPGEFHREARLIAHPPMLPSGCFSAIAPLCRTFPFVWGEKKSAPILGLLPWRTSCRGAVDHVVSPGPWRTGWRPQIH